MESNDAYEANVLELNEQTMRMQAHLSTRPRYGAMQWWCNDFRIIRLELAAALAQFGESRPCEVDSVQVTAITPAPESESTESEAE